MRQKAGAYPYLLWSGIFVIVPLILILFYSLTVTTVDGETIFSLDNFRRFFEPIYIDVVLSSVKVAALTTFFCFVLGYPVAYILANNKKEAKSVILFLFIVPMWLNMLLRTYSWLTILETNGLINNFLAFLGLPKVQFLYTDFAVILGLVYDFLPFMILPIYTVLTKIDRSIIEAAQDLGADNVQVFRKVVFPLSLPGVVSGVTMVFMPSLTSFVVPNILGGGQYMLVGNLIEQQFLRVGDWGFGSAISTIILLIMVISMYVFGAFDKEPENVGGGLF